MENKSTILGGVLLIAGTTIGAGMLALPIVSGLTGLIPSLILFISYWLYMTYTAFLMLEVNLSMEEENSNLISMAKKTLGRPGEVFSWFAYMLLLYLLTTAYLAVGGPLLAGFIEQVTGVMINPSLQALPLIGIFGFFMYEGMRYIDFVNRVLMLGLVTSFCLLVGMLIPYIEVSNYEHVSIPNFLLAVSLLATSFGFHVIIPSLTTYMKKDVKKLKKAVLLGSSIPLVIYIIWEFATLGVIPFEGAGSIVEGYLAGNGSIEQLAKSISNKNVIVAGKWLGFFAVVTSFIGVSKSLMDFLSDGLKIKKQGFGRVLLILLTFCPPLVFIEINPRPFISALEYAGAFGVMLTLGILPSLMVWKLRYSSQIKQNLPYRAPGGKLALCLVVVIGLSVVAVEIINKLGFIPLQLSGS